MSRYASRVEHVNGDRGPSRSDRKQSHSEVFDMSAFTATATSAMPMPSCRTRMLPLPHGLDVKQGVNIGALSSSPTA